jgi:hypothetical protein
MVGMTDHCPAAITYKGMIKMYTEELKNIVRNIVNTVSPSYWSKQNLIIRPNFQQIVQSTSFLPTNIKLCARLYCILNNIETQPLCAICGNPVRYEWLGALKGFKKYCGKCQRKSIETRSKREETIFNKFGVKNISQSDHFKISYKQTMLHNYGVEHAMHSSQIKQKHQNTCIKRFGSNSPLGNKSIINKNKKIWKNKFGVENPMQNKDIRTKAQNTCIKRYGVPIITQNPQFVLKALTTRYKNNMLYCPQKGTNEQSILDLQEQQDNCIIDRNFRVGLFYPDGYCKETNTIYEVYEKYHKSAKRQIKDKERQKYIQDQLQCNFIIIWDCDDKPIDAYPYNTQQDLQPRKP